MIMRQKYTLCREEDKKRLSIKEYAILERVRRGPAAPMSIEPSFSFLGEEIYDSSTIEASIGKGINSLVMALRTEGMYPIWSTAIKIAESVRDLYDRDGNGTVDLIFDDNDQLGQSATTPA